MSKRSFKQLSTSTDGKIAYEYELIKQMPRHMPGDKIITLIGALDGLVRQLKLLTSAGAEISDIIVVERDEATYNVLASVAAQYGYRVVFGDFIDVLKYELEIGTIFSLVDFDGTEGIGSYTMIVAEICSHFVKQIRALHIVTSTRCSGNNAKTCKDMALRLNLPESFRYAYVPIKKRDESVPVCGYKWTTKYAKPLDVFIAFVNQKTQLKIISQTLYKGRHKMYGFLLE